MNARLETPQTSGLFHLSPLRAVAVAALIGNAVLFAFDVVPSAPEGHNIPHLIISLIVTVIVALRFRWTPVVGALASAGQIVKGLIFLGTIQAASERERDVLDLIAQGLNNAAIATRLVLSQKTVRNHVSNIFAKLQVVDRSEAIVRARNAGLGR